MEMRSMRNMVCSVDCISIAMDCSVGLTALISEAG